MPLNLILQIAQIGISQLPQLAQDFELAKSLMQSGQDPTPEQQAQLDAAYEKVHQAVQAAVAARA